MSSVDFIYSSHPIEYNDGIKFMQQKVERIKNKEDNQAIWLLEHQNIYTLGRSATKSDIIKNIDIPYVKTDRGGKITYHGPGQRIIYIMLSLKEIFNDKPDIKLFTDMLDKWIVNLLYRYDIPAYIDKNNIGIWTKNETHPKKIASIGIKLSKWISFHGIALNINPNMNFFSYINPCGLKDNQMTSFYNEKNIIIESDKLNQDIKETFFKIFSFKLGNEYQI